MASKIDSNKATPESARKTHRLMTPTDNNTPPLPNIPQELIHEILLRLPAKSLVRFRCVCKSWNTLISNTHFAKKHLHISTLNSHDYTRIEVVKNSSTNPKCYTLDSLLNQRFPREIEIDYPMKTPDSSATVIGSCHGLLFANVVHCGEPRFCIWNPCTREYKMLAGGSSSSSFLLVHGFGYDKSTDDYKVVIFHDSLSPLCVGVYSLRANSCKKIQEFPFGSPFNQPCELVNGALHWLVYRHVRMKRYLRIVSFDLAQERFQMVPQPDYGDGDFRVVMRVLDGCLCVVSCGSGVRADVWIMKEYGVRESWMKLVTVGYKWAETLKCSKPLWTLRNGKILMESFGVLFLYDPKDGRRVYTVAVDGLSGCYNASIFIDSLISPNAAPMPLVEGDGAL